MGGDRRGEEEIRRELAAERQGLAAALGELLGTIRAGRKIARPVVPAVAVTIVSAVLRRRLRSGA